MEKIKKLALVVIIISIIIGSAFGLLASSNEAPNRVVRITANAFQTRSAFSCGGIPANFSNWMILQIHANQTFLNLISITALSSAPSITIDMDLNKTSYVFYHTYNTTFETLTVPLPAYWPVGEDLEVSVNYYYTGSTPIADNVGSVPMVKGNVTC